MRYGSLLAVVLPIAIISVGVAENATIKGLVFQSSSYSGHRILKQRGPDNSNHIDNVQTGFQSKAHGTTKGQSSALVSDLNLEGTSQTISLTSLTKTDMANTQSQSSNGVQGGHSTQSQLQQSQQQGSTSNSTTSSSSASGQSTSGQASSSNPSTPLPYTARLSSGVQVSPDNFGLNVAEWDNGMNASSTIPAIRKLGTGLQRYPNNDAWSWKLNRSRNGSDNYRTWNSFTSPFSMLRWSSELKATGNQGIFNINYGMNSQWNGGQSVSDVRELTQYIVSHHIPVRAMVVGSENYAGGTINLRANKSPAEYADVAKQMAIAIHQIDPSMKVGVNLTPGLNGRMSSTDLKWNETVLRTDAPYIQFVTFHVYPVDNAVSQSGLLQTLMKDVPDITSEVRRLLIGNTGKYASHIQVWFTEFNLFSQPRPKTVQNIGGTAMMESMLLARSLGVNEVDWWSLHGGAHALMSNGQVASPEVHHAVSQYGTFALTGDGQAPEKSMNSLYPTGQALSELTSLVRGGAQLDAKTAGNLLVAKITRGSSAHWVVVNTGNTNETVQVNGVGHTVAAHTYTVLSSSASSTLHTPDKAVDLPASALVTSSSLAVQASHQAPPATPHISSVSASDIHSNEVLTLHGSGFGSSRGSGYVSFSNNNVHWGSPQNFYKLNILKWTNSEIQFVTPSQSVPHGSVNLKPGSSASATVFTGNQASSNTVQMHVQTALPAQLSTAQLTPGKTVTVTGNGFGSSQGNGYVQVSDQGVNIGSPSNFYKLRIVSWTNGSITFVVPTQHLTPGTAASVRVMAASGIETVTMNGSVH
ncbi:hypothetical protein [Alicyclobacillus sp. SO9]|uniref:hypothetical protein n=1 Tax=Alicyclobacillus sp. SO9 TaxID=2665646 RepID=UPI0018E6FA7D|nr:hypothetical protein [Alicyclobacillus sp. SO9]QQE79326.1 hypothetical protein GI364_02105 [Alicyclobacillus sp. SO9]